MQAQRAVHALEYRFGSRLPLGFSVKSEANVASVTGPLGACQRPFSIAHCNKHKLCSSRLKLPLLLPKSVPGARPAGPRWSLKLANVCAGRNAIVDASGFDLAGLDTAIWNDVLDAASVADDFGF